MAHFAELDDAGIVQRVIVVHNNDAPDEAAGKAFIANTLRMPGRWLQCSYNASRRKNYPGPGYHYDAARDAFIPPQPWPSWPLDETTCRWQPPTPMPASGEWLWNEAQQQWIPA